MSPNSGAFIELKGSRNTRRCSHPRESSAPFFSALPMAFVALDQLCLQNARCRLLLDILLAKSMQGVYIGEMLPANPIRRDHSIVASRRPACALTILIGEQTVDSKTQVLLDAVLALPVPDRAALAQAVLESLSPSGEDLSDEELDNELMRRADELRADPSSALAWSEVKKLR